MKPKDNKQRLFEMMGKIDPTFKPNAKLLTEWNFDKKKGDVDKDDDKEEDKKEDKDEKKETSGKKKWNFEKKDDKETPEEEKSETPEEEKDEDKKELKEEDNAGKKIPVTNWDKAKHGK